MRNLKTSSNGLYNEAQAAAALGITVGRLHQLLDKHIFPEGSRPANIEFTASDLILLRYWCGNDHTPAPVITMPLPK